MASLELVEVYFVNCVDISLSSLVDFMYILYIELDLETITCVAYTVHS